MVGLKRMLLVKNQKRVKKWKERTTILPSKVDRAEI
jgi:hypothetical protein